VAFRYVIQTSMSLKYEPSSEPLLYHSTLRLRVIKKKKRGPATWLSGTASSVLLSSLELSDAKVYEP